MIDAHCHILPGVDDGVGSINELMDIVPRLKSYGIDKVITTSHIKDNWGNIDHYRQIFDNVKFIFDQDNVDVAFGCEFNWSKLLDGNMGDIHRYTLGKSNLLLLEFSMSELPVNWHQMIKKIQNQNIQVIVAHPERISSIQNDFSVARQMHDMGVYFMLSSQFYLKTYMGGKMRKSAKKMLKEGLVDMICSDSHSLAGYDCVTKALSFAAKYGYTSARADQILSQCF